ncbi:LOW QUALITY PROTEIN: voltage-dependent T-type calcium channel subunit alpha-1H-like [Tachyglossus aculeatus]|uniref:LOW QUALITY PROTEIN: voltage-dependent T-type calcium channel subunit alpha-1H-like n=1 Tax=Tachyglossus aculeatus TaxID=9261 RepID=UPI0018F5D305|nr:LOW QUALITY PROTEIN: voltage-dependent T-type calcium channel subunit alpha-1H-like [Tachyglossus aculeatus]
MAPVPAPAPGSDGAPVPYPALAPTVFFCLQQTTRPRSWCLGLVCNPWFEHVSMLAILLNCVTLGMFRPCEDVECRSQRCAVLEAFDDFIFAFFAVEMVAKMIALGVFGQKCYLGDTWNRLDFFIVIAGMMEYSLDGHNVSLSAIRTIRVLRPLRAINRVPSMRILVTLLLDTLPMLGNVLLLCCFVFFVFGVVAVQLWAGLLRNRCFLDSDTARSHNLTFLKPYYQPEDGEENPYICSAHRDNGMQKCSGIPRWKEQRLECNLSIGEAPGPQGTPPGTVSRHACVNWNQYYNVCRTGDVNPHNGAINFDNIGYAWIAIFQVITLEGWVEIMYYVMDAHSFYNFIYFILLIIVGSFFMINLCLVVIATQFSETKQRENQLMREQRARSLSNDSTLASFSEPGSLYDELLKYLGHIFRKAERRAGRLYARWQSHCRKVGPDGLGGRGQVGRGRGRVASQCPLARHHHHHHHHHYHHHHHHHHHHHYHLGNGSPGPELLRLDVEDDQSGSQLMLPVPTPRPWSPQPDSASTRSVYRSDCHVMALGDGGRQDPRPGPPSGRNYPTILPSAAARPASGIPVPGGGGSPGSPASGPHSPNHLDADTCKKLRWPVGEPGPGQSVSVPLSTLSAPCPLQRHQDGLPSCDPQSCPLCSRPLEDCEFEFSESGSCDSDPSGTYEFTRDLRRRDHRDPVQRAGQLQGQTEAPQRRSMAIRLWLAFGHRLERIVDSKYFNRGIMAAILINTLSMGVEYHEQPDELTNALEISNSVFTSVFALEMLLKLLACGPIGYVKNPYNIFDGVIVVISVCEIIGQADGGLSVLRTFRLLRVLKLLRFLPALRRQLVVLVKTMDNVATFCMLLMLFIFIFSILGMHLFGCKFSLKTDTGDTVPDRKNFDSLLWAIVTVFQILTQEDWNMVLYNGMASTSSWAALYFVALMTFGNYVLFNLLVAILVEGFQAEGDANKSDTDEDKTSVNVEDDFDKISELWASGGQLGSGGQNGSGGWCGSDMKNFSLAVMANGHLEGRGSLPPPMILHTAATPGPTPQGSPQLDSGPALLGRQWAGSASIDPLHCDQRSSASPRSSPCASRSPTGPSVSRRASWNSLGRPPSLKRRSHSGERQSLLAGEGRGCADEDADNILPGTRPPLIRQAESLDCRLLSPPTPECHTPRPGPATDHQGTQSQALHGNGELFLHLDACRDQTLDYDDDVDDGFCFRVHQVLDRYKPGWCKSHEDWSLYLFSPQNRVRVMCRRFIAHKMFDHVVLAFIFLNCITIALERPDIDPSSTERVFLSVSNYIFTAIFVVEMMVKVTALGFFSGDDAYLQSGWNVLDGLLVFVSITDIVVSMAPAGGARILGVLRVLRLLRTLRPLRVISRAPGLKLVVETLISSLRPIGNIVLICCAFFIVFGILGVQLFKGKFYYCEGSDTKNITTRGDCSLAHYRWVRRKYNFDNLGQALMSLFVLSSKDGWVNIMYDGLDAVGVDQQPIQNHNPWMLLYFISFLLIVSFFVLNMFVGVVVENFHKCREHQEAEEARRREEKRLRRLDKKRRKAQRRPYYADYSPLRLSIHTLCTSHYLDLFITFIIGVNVITMSMEHYNQPKSLDEALKYCNYVFTIVFVFEAVLKLVAFGIRRFFKDRWNQLDLAIVLLSTLGITLEEIEINAALPINPTIIRIMRVLRIARVLKLLKMATGMRALLDTVVQALPQVGNLGLLFMLLFFIYAALGVELFGKLDCSDDNPCEGLSRHATFSNFGMAFLTLFRVSTGDNWNGIMKDTLRECPREDKHCLSYLPVISPIYFVTFVLIAQFVLVNVVVAVLMKHLEESNKEAREDAEMDAEIELEMAQTGPGPVSLRPRGSPPGCRMPQPSLDGACLLKEAPDGHNPPVIRKIPVSRMHSLPNDSYMFRPLVPAQAPRPLPEVDTGPQDLDTELRASQVPTGSGTLVHSQPEGTSSSLALLPRTGSFYSKSSDLPGTHIRSPSLSRLLCRQEAMRTDSVDSPLAECEEGPLGCPTEDKPLHSPPGISSLGLADMPTQPHPSCPQDEPCDPADEEVSHINSTAHARGVLGPARSRSAYTSPGTGPRGPGPTSSNSAGSLAQSAGHDRDLRKFYSVDAHGFLDQPGWASDQRRHSIEICPARPEAPGLAHHEAPNPAPPVADPVPPGGRRKKKMSPPCIAIDPPVGSQAGGPQHSLVTPGAASVVAEASTMLRRRTPSWEPSAPRGPADLADAPPGDLLLLPPPTRACRWERLAVPHPAFESPVPGTGDRASEPWPGAPSERSQETPPRSPHPETLPPDRGGARPA